MTDDTGLTAKAKWLQQHRAMLDGAGATTEEADRLTELAGEMADWSPREMAEWLACAGDALSFHGQRLIAGEIHQITADLVKGIRKAQTEREAHGPYWQNESEGE